MSTEIPIWVNGKIRWLSGIDKKTTCRDVVEILLEGKGTGKSEVKDFAIMERWRKVERPLDENSKILKIWSHWGNEKKEVRLCLRRIDNEVDSGRGSPIGCGNTPSLRRKRSRARGNGKPPWAHPETLHPRRLAEFGKFSKKDYDEYQYIKTKLSETNDDSDRLNDTFAHDKPCNYEDIHGKIYDTENINNRKKSGQKSYHCSATGRLHSTLLLNQENLSKKTSKCCSKKESKQKVRNSENIEKLMKLILAQGATIQNQLQKLKEREEQIESLEHERHRERLEKNGRNYLLETYLGSLKYAEIPAEGEECNGNETEVHSKGTSDQINFIKGVNMEKLNQIETEPDSDKSTKIYGRGQLRPGHRGEDSNNQISEHHSPTKSYPKSTRSKSESRTHECKLERNLKRTLSDNVIAETSGVVISDNGKKENNNVELDEQITKEESEVVELRRIQSQIEMWEKVFKINKKLEKEEENLVRLHVKIRKFQSENYRIAKEKLESNEKENVEEPVSSNCTSEVIAKEINDPHEVTYKQECAEVQKNLETLRSNIEQNSKEIHQNFTRIIEDDEIVEQKRSCLIKLLSDLERTNHEHDMLNEMIAIKEKRNSVPEQVVPVSKYSNATLNDFGGENNPNKLIPTESNGNNNFVPTQTLSNTNVKNMWSNVLNTNKTIQDDFNQRKDADEEQKNYQLMKPKIVTISFDDQIKNYESSEKSQEISLKEPARIASGVLKSILKNKKNVCNKNVEKCHFITDSQQFGDLSQGCGLKNDKLIPQNNLNLSNGYVQLQFNCPLNIPDRIPSNYPYEIPNPIYNPCPHEPSQNFYCQPPLTKLSDDLKTAYPIRSPHPSEIQKTSINVFPPSTMVTTKALVHNDTDSSTSSDTSGLSSMYSSSPTVEEPYVEQPYVLDTLV